LSGDLTIEPMPTRHIPIEQSRQPKLPVADRRAERELFFWTAEHWLRLVALGALTAYSVVSLIEGRMPVVEALRHLVEAAR
jgi:hypothetical protein